MLSSTVGNNLTDHHVRTPLGGTITLEIHVVSSGETRIHEGLSDLAAQRLACCSQAPLMASLLPSSSTEVASLGKIATFVFRYRTMSASFSLTLSLHRRT